jgi:putative transposase
MIGGRLTHRRFLLGEKVGGQDVHPTRGKSFEIGRRAGCPPHKREERGGGKTGMGEFKIRERRLPHWELDGAVYFVTFNTWEKLELESRAKQIILDACLFFNRSRYQLFALVIMNDHVHLIIQPWQKSESEFWSLSSIMKSIKGYSSKEISKATTHIGIVWQDERYDRIIRNQKELYSTWEYIRQNPVKAGLSDSPEEYAFLWQMPSFPLL